MAPSVQHVEATPGIKRLRLRRGIRRLAGSVVLALATLTGVLGLLFLVALFKDGFDGETLAQSWLLLIPIALSFFAHKLRSGPRSQVLYLRGFERVGTEAVVTLAATGAIGRDYRLVTLDDAKLPPVGVPKRARRQAWMTIVVGLLVIGLSVHLGRIWMDEGIESAVNSGFEAGAAGAGEGIGEAIQGIFAGLVLALVLGMVVGTLVLIPAILLGVLGAQVGLASVAAVLAMRRAESRKRFAIETPAQLEALRAFLDRSRRKRWAPRLLVVKVLDTLWQDVVRDVGGDCLATLMDLSHPSEGLYWEAVHFIEKDPRPCVLVAEEESFRSWFEADSSEPLHRRFRDLLKDVTVVPFSASAETGGRRFRQSVRAALDGVYLAGEVSRESVR